MIYSMYMSFTLDSIGPPLSLDRGTTPYDDPYSLCVRDFVYFLQCHKKHAKDCTLFVNMLLEVLVVYIMQLPHRGHLGVLVSMAPLPCVLGDSVCDSLAAIQRWTAELDELGML